MTRLASAADEAADAWVDAVGIASAKGDHRPAKDLLLHSRVIEPLAYEGGGVTVQIGISSTDVSVMFGEAPVTAAPAPRS